MAKEKHKKEEPRFKVQREYETQFKYSYYNMLKNMNKTIIVQLLKIARK